MWDDPDLSRGLFINRCLTKNQSVGEVISSMKRVMTELAQKPVTAEELLTAKRPRQNACVPGFDNPSNILDAWSYGKLVGRPDDFQDTSLARIKRVDSDKVLSMAKRTLHPDELVILVIGKKTEILGQLKALKLGDITELPVPDD